MRTIVDLPDDQIEALKELSERSRLSRAELMRRAVAEFLEHHPATVPDEVFGIWKGREKDSLRYQQSLRGEWDR